MKFNTALKVFVVITASSAKYIHAGGQSVVVDDTSKTTMAETLSVAGGGRFDGINNLRQTVVDPVTRADASSSKTDTMRHTVADAAASDFLLKTLPVVSGGRFSPSGINNLHRTVVGPIIGDAITSFTGNANYRAVDLSVADVQSKQDISTTSDGSLNPPSGIIDQHAIFDDINDDDEVSSFTGATDRGVSEDALGFDDVQQSIHDLFPTSDGSLIPPSDTVNHHADGGSIVSIPHHRELEATCSDSNSGAEGGGDCSANPTYCEVGGFGSDENIVNCRCNGPDPFFHDDPDPYFHDESMRSCYRVDSNNPPPSKCGYCFGSCSGTDSCLNLDFHCAEGVPCGLDCWGENSCEGVTMYCPHNQVCALRGCDNGTERCVGAQVKCRKGTVAVGDFACEPLQHKYEIMPVLGIIGTSMLGGTGTHNHGAIFRLNFEHSNELCLNDCNPNELTVSVHNSLNFEGQCDGDTVNDSTKQTVTVIDGSFLSYGNMPQYSNGKISMIEVTFDDVFEANMIGTGSTGSVISLCIRVESTDGTHIFGKIDTVINQAIEFNGEIRTSNLGVGFGAYSNNLVLEGTLNVEDTPPPYMCHEDGEYYASGAVFVGDIMNICCPDDEQFQVEYIKDVTCSNEFLTFNPSYTTDWLGLTSGKMISIEIKSEYLPANSGTSVFECFGVIVYSYYNGDNNHNDEGDNEGDDNEGDDNEGDDNEGDGDEGYDEDEDFRDPAERERHLFPRQLQESTVEEPEAEFSLTIMITNEDPTIDSSGTKMTVIPVSTVIVPLLILQIVALFK